MGNIEKALGDMTVGEFKEKCNTVLVNSDSIMKNQWEDLSSNVENHYNDVYNIWMEVGGIEFKKKLMDTFGGYVQPNEYDIYTRILVDKMIEWIKSFN